jgi:hypothetical protein
MGQTIERSDLMKLLPRMPGTARILVAGLIAFSGVCSARPLAGDEPVRGWTILSDSVPDALVTIAAAPAYHINHVQLSHQIVHDLREIKGDAKRDLVKELTGAAHRAGISEVVLWDHTLYKLDYYPKEFLTGPGGTIDLDNPEFWKWFQEDYRRMLDRVPAIDGLVLTFIETGARAERQHSTQLKSNAEKLARVVNAVADVVVGERRLNLYVRTFSYTQKEYANVLGAIALLKRPDIRLMMKETPHDFFLTHPDDPYAGTIARPTIMEFDIAGEFNGQGIIATTWPEYVLRRWRAFARRSHIIGYTARTDRYGSTRLVGRPAEIDLLALRRGEENPQVTAEEIYDEFITARYGAAALPEVKAAFKNAYEIVTASMYTLGTSMANHSRLDYDQAASSYVRHVSGKWMVPPTCYVGHGVNREFHYWRDTITHLAPPHLKNLSRGQWSEVPEVVSSGWIQRGEGMTEEYLRYIVTEKKHGVALAEDSARHIDSARPKLRAEDYEELRHYFQRTLLTARIYQATASAYFGFRTWCRGKEHQTGFVCQTTQDGLNEIKAVVPRIRDYPRKPAVGQWDWRQDADTAERYHNWIVRDGWPVKGGLGTTPYGGKKFEPQADREPR